MITFRIEEADGQGLILNQYIQTGTAEKTLGATLFVPEAEVRNLLEEIQEYVSAAMTKATAEGKFFQRLYRDRFDCFHVEYSSDEESWIRLIPNLTSEQASYMHCDGWPIIDEGR